MKLIEKFKKKIAKPAQPLFKTFSSEWAYNFTFSFKGQHFIIEATDNAKAWQKAKMLVGKSNGLFLLEKGNAHCIIKYQLA